ncbi:right-handed parallel beta-helix repeat-containing protein [Treponema sp.]|uniref:right-handed parallel beta-helix repeat-containing protein n=1 Tax=Treponema sp. TaxID=166 RepID=UPI00298E25AF|nr:right-handed parallel beta-helix repeat-containing protein [Treponema sp.]MCQ2240159.1 right-handed parallel beta-helix repeat-containing protein [Treponema sp.]
MKKFSFLLFTIAAFFVFSCNNLNLRNPAGSLIVSMPDLDSRAIVQEDQTVENYKDISYRISLYSLSDELVEEKTGEPGKPVEFSEISEGSYVLKGICFSKIDGIDSGIASGYVDVVVTGGEITSVNLPLIYNRLNRIDESKSSIRYEGPLEFTQPEEIYSESELFAYIKTEISKGLSAELFFTNGWKETVRDGFVIGDVVPIIVEEEFVDDEKIGMVTRRDGADDEPLKMESGDGTGKIEDIASGDVFHFAGECTVKVVYGGTSLSEEIKIKIRPIESEEPEIPDDGGQVVNPVDPKEPGEGDDDTEKQPGTPENPAVGLSEANPCRSFEDLKTANANASNGATIYLASGTFEMAETFPVTKTITLLAVDGDVTIKRTAGGAYIYVGDGEDTRSITLNINDSGASNKFIFTDDESVVTDSPFIYGPNENKSVVAYKSEFNGIKSDVISVKNATISGCTFEENSSNGGIVVCDSVNLVSCTFDSNTCTRYGAIHVASYCSATVDGCTFSGNESTQNSGYGDIYLAKGSEDTTLTLSGTVTTDIGIYVDNAENVDPEIVFDATNYGGNLNITIKNGPKTGIDSMIILSCTGIPNQEKIRVIVDGSTDAYMSFTSGNDYCLTKTSF